MSDAGAMEVVKFWIEAGPEKWWIKNADFDAEIENRFGAIHRQACKGELDHWAETAQGAMALILILDQFSRHLHRNSPKAYDQDSRGAVLARALSDSGQDQEIPHEIRYFIYMPLMHSEALEDQEHCIEMMRRYGEERPLNSAIQHRDIIAQFGRFPHRNKVLGRETTAEEQAFLDAGGFAG
ncbi:MAG: DUF924 family protein [Rhizobiaceae bacterium]